MRALKGFTLFISNEHTNDITKIIRLLEDPDVLIDRVNETVKEKIRRRISWSFISTHFISAINDLFGSKRYKWNLV